MRRERTQGFTLIELIIAASLAMVVLLALFGMMSSMVRFQVEGLRRSTVTGWSMASIVKMNKEIESAGVVAYPADATPRDFFASCVNWSRILASSAAGGREDPTQGVVVIYYCYDGTAIRRLTDETSGLCPTSASLPGGAEAVCNTTGEIVAVGVKRHSSGNLVFTRDDAVGGIRIRFSVGDQTHTVPAPGSPDIVNPQFVEFDTTVTTNRAYNNPYD